VNIVAAAVRFDLGSLTFQGILSVGFPAPAGQVC
jgi:hypothetical protein